MQAVKEEEWDRLNKLENSKVQVLVYVGLITYVRSTILLNKIFFIRLGVHAATK